MQDAEALLKAAIQAEYSGESIESQITAAIAIAVVDFGLKLSSSNCHYVLVPVPVKAVGAAIVHLKQRLSLGSKSLASIVFELHLERYFSISEGASSKQITVRPAALLPDATDAVRRLLPGVAWSESSSEVAAQAKRVTEAASCEPSSSSQQVIMHTAFTITGQQASQSRINHDNLFSLNHHACTSHGCMYQPWWTKECSTCTENAFVCVSVQIRCSQADQAWKMH